MGRLTGAAFNAMVHRDDHGRFSGGSTVRRLLGADTPNAPKTREVHTPGGSTVSIASRAKGRSLTGMATRASTSTPKPKTNADFAPGGPKHIDIARVARGLGDRSDFDHATGNYLDDAQRQLDSGATPGQVAKGLDEDARRLSTSNSIRFGVGGSGFRPEHPDDRAARLRQRDEGAAQVDRLRQLASRLRETRRPTARRGGLQKTAKKAVARPPFDAKATAARVSQASTKEEATALLQGRTVAQLRDIAGAAGVPTFGTRKADILNNLVAVLVGIQSETNAMFVGARRTDVDERAVARRIASRRTPRS